MVNDLEKTLSERNITHGNFLDNSRIAQVIKAMMRTSKNWPTMTYDQKEALEMIAHKIARIVSGDSRHADSWHDIGGYARLVENRIVEGESKHDE